MIIHTNQTSKRKPQNTPEKQQLRQDWDKLLQKYETKAYTKPKTVKAKKPEPYRRETKHYPSLDTGGGQATQKPQQEYTGSEMIGIGQLHKSNAIPVFKQQDAEDLAKMRR